jgi:type II pantothenate kinase
VDITTESAIPGRALAAIDFGISNTDAVSLIDGTVYRWTRPTDGVPNDEVVHSVLAEGGLSLSVLPHLAVTGGRHRILPARIDSIPLRAVNEVTAIGRGGQTLGAIDESNTTAPMLVVSAGSGTAVVAARGREYSHVTGTGVGGGTLQGLGRLLLGTNDARTIDQLAQQGNPNGADLSIGDVISGKLGTLPPDATAVNFGRLAHLAQDASRPDLAAALMTLVGQVIAITAINAARAERLDRIVVIGHMTDMPSFRTVVERVGEFYSTEITLPLHAGFGTAIGAMLHEANS